MRKLAKNVMHSFYWYHADKKIGYCHTCKKEIKANSAYHFQVGQQLTLSQIAKETMEYNQ